MIKQPILQDALLIAGLGNGMRVRVDRQSDTVSTAEMNGDYIDTYIYKRVELNLGHIPLEVALFVPDYIPETERVWTCVEELRKGFEAHVAFMDLEKPLP